MEFNHGGIRSFASLTALVSIVLTAGLIPVMRRPGVETAARRLFDFPIEKTEA